MHSGRETWHMLLFLWHSLLAPPTASVWLAVCVRRRVCMSIMRGGGAFPFALCLALFRHFQLEGVVSLETDLNFKPIWGQRENIGWASGMGAKGVSRNYSK